MILSFGIVRKYFLYFRLFKTFNEINTFQATYKNLKKNVSLSRRYYIFTNVHKIVAFGAMQDSLADNNVFMQSYRPVFNP